jgi:hypothetical protein
LNFVGAPLGRAEDADAGPATLDVNARVVHAGLRSEAGEPVENVEQGEPITVDVVLEAARDLERPIFVFHVLNADGTVVFGFLRTLDAHVAKGQRVRLSGRIENRLVAGRYMLDCWIRQDGEQSVMALQALRLVHFVVYGTAPRHGLVALETDVVPTLEGADG